MAFDLNSETKQELGLRADCSPNKQMLLKAGQRSTRDRKEDTAPPLEPLQYFGNCPGILEPVTDIASLTSSDGFLMILDSTALYDLCEHHTFIVPCPGQRGTSCCLVIS